MKNTNFADMFYSIKPVTLLFISLLFLSCDKQEPAILEIEVSYFYNNFIGFKPDVGAKAYLFDHSQTSNISMDSMTVVDARMGKLTSKTGDWLMAEPVYEGEAGASGLITIDNINPGYYLLILASEGRWSFTHKHQHVNSGEELKLVKNFNYYNEFKQGGEAW